jgi:hypothetical protein
MRGVNGRSRRALGLQHALCVVATYFHLGLSLCLHSGGMTAGVKHPTRRNRELSGWGVVAIWPISGGGKGDFYVAQP